MVAVMLWPKHTINQTYLSDRGDGDRGNWPQRAQSKRSIEKWHGGEAVALMAAMVAMAMITVAKEAENLVKMVARRYGWQWML